MPNTRHKASYSDLANIRWALASLRAARRRLRAAGSDRAADYVARAIKSAEGALRHAQLCVQRK